MLVVVSTCMDRHGHVGLNLLVYTPIAYYLFQSGQAALAAVGLVALFALEPLIDLDYVVPGATHRGTSHSLFGALVVGLLCGVGVYILTGVAVTTFTQAAFGQPVIVSGASEQSPLNPVRNAKIGVLFGIGAVLLHLIGDSITRSGIRPFLPFARSRLAFELISEEGWAQFVLFGIGLIAFGGMFLVAHPSVRRGLIGF